MPKWRDEWGRVWRGRIGVTGGLQGEEVMGLKCETPMRWG